MSESKGMSKEAWAHNEWMRQYIESPNEFAREFEEVTTFLAESVNGAPSYGEQCEAFMAKLMAKAPESEEERMASFRGWEPEMLEVSAD